MPEFPLPAAGAPEVAYSTSAVAAGEVAWGFSYGWTTDFDSGAFTFTENDGGLVAKLTASSGGNKGSYGNVEALDAGIDTSQAFTVTFYGVETGTTAHNNNKRISLEAAGASSSKIGVWQEENNTSGDQMQALVGASNVNFSPSAYPGPADIQLEWNGSDTAAVYVDGIMVASSSGESLPATVYPRLHIEDENNSEDYIGFASMELS